MDKKVNKKILVKNMDKKILKNIKEWYNTLERIHNFYELATSLGNKDICLNVNLQELTNNHNQFRAMHHLKLNSYTFRLLSFENRSNLVNKRLMVSCVDICLPFDQFIYMLVTNFDYKLFNSVSNMYKTYNNLKENERWDYLKQCLNTNMYRLPEQQYFNANELIKDMLELVRLYNSFNINPIEYNVCDI
jgi:hypothetical protein